MAYEYRKEFGLSHYDYMNEPLEVFQKNIMIMSLMRKKQNRQVRKKK